MGRPFICTDSARGKLLRFSPAGELLREYDVPLAFDVWVLPDGNLLASMLNGPLGPGVVLLRPDGETLLYYRSAGEVFGCQPLPDGHIMVGELDPCGLVEINRHGKVISRIPCRTTCAGHESMRMPRLTVDGTWLVCHKGEQVVREYAIDGTVMREIATPGPVFVAIRLPNGNTLFSCELRLVEVDVSGREVWSLDQADVPELGIRLLTGLQRLPNGNTVACNWLGHGQEGRGVPLFEVNPAKEIVWRFDNVPITSNVGNFQLLDQPAPLFR